MGDTTWNLTGVYFDTPNPDGAEHFGYYSTPHPGPAGRPAQDRDHHHN
jgi:hypothetical protein